MGSSITAAATQLGRHGGGFDRVAPEEGAAAADDYAATAPCATMRRVRAAAWNGAAQTLPLLPHRLLLQ